MASIPVVGVLAFAQVILRLEHRAEKARELPPRQACGAISAGVGPGANR